MVGKSIFEKQEVASQALLAVTMSILVTFTTSMGASYVYGGLTLEHHRGGEERGSFLQLTEDEGSWYMSLVPLLNMVASLAASQLGEWLGRKKVLIVSTILNIGGFVFIHFSSSFWLLALGRAVSSFGCGIGVMMPFVLISEISTIRARAPLSVLNTVSLSLGILLSFIFLFIFPAAYLIFFTPGISVVFLVLSPILPESPHFLVRKGRLDEARATLKRLRGAEYMGIEDEIEEVIKLMEMKKERGTNFISRWSKRTFLQPVSILMVLMFFISVNGIDCPMSFYGPSMFVEFGFSWSPRLLACVIPVGQLLGYGLAPLIMKVMSKKAQYILATTSMAACLGGLALSYQAKEAGWEPGAVVQAGFMACSLGLTCGYGIGMGSVTYAMPGELLSPEDKTIGINVAQCCRMVGTAAVLKAYPLLVATLGYPALLLGHASALLAAAAFVTWCLPETRNKSLTEIQGLFTGIQQLSKIAEII